MARADEVGDFGLGWLVREGGDEGEGAVEFQDPVFDIWMTLHFTPGQMADPMITGPDADPDGDGVENLKEFASNLNPTTADEAVLVAGSGTSGLPLVEVRNVSGGERLVVEYIRRLGIGDLVYTPLFGMDLGDPGTWSTGGVETVTPIDSSFERVVREDGVVVDALETGIQLQLIFLKRSGLKENPIFLLKKLPLCPQGI